MRKARLERKVRVTYINGIRTREAECRAHAELIADLFAAPCYALHNKTAGAWADLSQVGPYLRSGYSRVTAMKSLFSGMQCSRHVSALVSARSPTPSCSNFHPTGLPLLYSATPLFSATPPLLLDSSSTPRLLLDSSTP